MVQVGVNTLEVVVQDMHFDACANIVDSRVLEYAEDVQDLLQWVALMESPMLSYTYGSG